MFVGRKAHLASLQALYGLPGSTSCAVYGRRRVGKTSMLSKFCKGKPSLFLTALQYSAESTLEDFSDSISEFLQSQGRQAVPPLKSLKDLLSFLSTIDGGRRPWSSSTSSPS